MTPSAMAAISAPWATPLPVRKLCRYSALSSTKAAASDPEAGYDPACHLSDAND